MIWTRRAAGCAVVAVLALVLAACGSSERGTTTAAPPTTDPYLAVKVKEQAAENRALQRKIARTKREQARAAAAEDEGEDGSGAGSSGDGTAGAATEASFAKLAAGLGGEVGVAYGPAGLDQPVTTLGPLQTGVAWSTAKVPVAVATVRADGGSPSGDHAGLMRSAITASDNAAAESLWSGLGGGAAAGAKVQAVLADAGDGDTQVQTERVRSGFTAFGQTEWPLPAAERLAAALPCLDGAGPVLDLMGQVTSDQSWGLGQAGANQRFKGGWGPDENGKYLVRQMGLIDVDGGTVAVAIAAKPSDGSLESGSAQLTQLAQWVAEHARGSAVKC